MVRYGAEPLSRSTRAPVPASLPRHSAQTPSGGAGGGGGSGSASPASSMGEDTAELALSSLPHGYESDADFDDLRTRLMASEEREGRLKSEVPKPSSPRTPILNPKPKVRTLNPTPETIKPKPLNPKP